MARCYRLMAVVLRISFRRTTILISPALTIHAAVPNREALNQLQKNFLTVHEMTTAAGSDNKLRKIWRRTISDVVLWRRRRRQRRRGGVGSVWRLFVGARERGRLPTNRTDIVSASGSICQCGVAGEVSFAYSESRYSKCSVAALCSVANCRGAIFIYIYNRQLHRGLVAQLAKLQHGCFVEGDQLDVGGGNGTIDVGHLHGNVAARPHRRRRHQVRMPEPGPPASMHRANPGR